MVNDLSGITVNSLPIKKFILESIFPEETISIFKEEVKKKNLIYHDSKVKYPDYKERSSKIKYLSKNQIRKEYGMEMKPFSSIAEGVLFIIYHNPRISVKNICSILGKNERTLSGQISRIYQKLMSSRYLIREDIRKEGQKKATYHYQIIDLPKDIEDPVKFLYDLYLGSLVRKRKSIKEKEFVPKDILSQLKDLCITIKVEGSLKILFGFEK